MKYDLQKFTSEVDSFVYFISYEVLTQDLLKRTNEWFHKDIYQYIYSVLFKTINGLASANLLFSNLDKKMLHIDSGYLVLRTMMSDNIIYIYLLLKANGNETQFIRNIKSLHADHIVYEIKSLKEIYRHGHKMSEKEYNARFKEIIEENRDLVDEEGKPLYKDIKANVTTAVLYALNRPNEVNTTPILKAYEHYEKYSKYEHFGKNTLYLSHRQFLQKNRDVIFEEYFDAVNLTIGFILSHMLAFYPDDHTNITMFKAMKLELLNRSLYEIPG